MSNSSNETIKIQVALVPPNCFPIYTQTNPMMNPYSMMLMNPYMNPHMNPQMFAFQQQQMGGMPNFPFMNTANYDISSSSHMNPFGPNNPNINNNMSGASIDNINGTHATSNSISGSTNTNNKSFNAQVEFHPSVLTFNVFIDPSKTILQLADAIYAKTSRLYPNLKRPLDILKLKDFEKNDLDIEDTVDDCFLKGNVSRLTVLCCTKFPLDFNTRNNNYRVSYVQGDSDYSNIMNSDFNNPEYDQSEEEGNFKESRVNSMTQLQLSRKRNVSLVYQNKQKVPSIIIQKKNRRQSNSLKDTNSNNKDKSPVDRDSLLPPPVERSPQMRISSNIGETRKRIFSTNLGQAMDAVSRSEEVDPDKRKTIDMVMIQNEANDEHIDTPSKDVSEVDVSPYKNATPNRMNSGLRMISANNTVVKSQPMPNMLMNSVQRHSTIPKKTGEIDQVKSSKQHGKLDFGGLTDPILKSPGSNSILPPKGDRIPMKQGLRDDINMLTSSSEDEDLDDEVHKQPLVTESHIVNNISSGKNDDLKDNVGQLTPLNVKTNSKKIAEDSPLRNEDADNSNNTSLLKMAQLPNEKAENAQLEDKMEVDDDNEDNSVIMNALDQDSKPLVIEGGRTKRRAALAAAGKLDNRSVRVTNNEGKEVIMPYNKVNSYMKNQKAAKEVTPVPEVVKKNNNLFDSLSNGGVSEPINSPMSVKTKNVEEKDVDMESSSSSSSSDSSSDSSSSDEDNENVEEDNNARKVKVDVDTTSQRVPSAKQLNSVGKITEPVLTKNPVENVQETENSKLSTLQRMRMHKNQKSLGSLSDLIARGIPSVMDRAAEKRLLIEKQRKDEEEKRELLKKQKEEENSSSSDSSSSDSDSDSDSSSDSDFDSKKKSNFIKKPKKKSESAFASLIKDSKKL